MVWINVLKIIILHKYPSKYQTFTLNHDHWISPIWEDFIHVHLYVLMTGWKKQLSLKKPYLTSETNYCHKLPGSLHQKGLHRNDNYGYLQAENMQDPPMGQ